MDYFEIYKKRLNRYGHDFQSRVQGQRERNFENYLAQSIYRVDCESVNINDKPNSFSAILERNRQDYSETQGYLLTPVTQKLDNGTILKVITGFNANEHGSPKLMQDDEYWMIWWLEEIAVSGYNKYIVLKMTHKLSWDGGKTFHLAYLSGPGTQSMQDTSKSAQNSPLYRERTTLYTFITPYAADLQKESYLEFQYPDQEHKLSFVVTDIDFISTKGIMYVSIDPSYERHNNGEIEEVQINKEDKKEEFYWLNPFNEEDANGNT